MTDSLSDRDPIDLLAEEFVERHRTGSCPSIEEFAREHSEHAHDIRELFPLIVNVEKLKSQKDFSGGGHASMGARKVEQIGDYRIIREIGRGGMGIVYEAEQQSLKRNVALKVLGRNIAGSEKQLKRFQIEAEAAASLHHTNIVPVYGVGESDGLQFIAMQLIDGLPLSDLIKSLRDKTKTSAAGSDSTANSQSSAGSATSVAIDGQLVADILDSKFQSPSDTGAMTIVDDVTNPGDALSTAASGDSAVKVSSHDSHVVVEPALANDTQMNRRGRRVSRLWRGVAEIGASIADGLSHAHQKGILHRDIKPGNLLLDRQGVAWVTDFGLAKTDDVAVTRTGDIVGTLRYMAPEQLDGQHDQRSDVYSLGLTLYELITLRPAWDETQHAQLIHLKSTTPPVPPRSVNRAIPRDLETIVLKAIALDPRHRYQSADLLAGDLRRFLDDMPILARRVSPAEKIWRWTKRNPVIAALATVTVASLAFVAIVFAVKNEQLLVEKNRAATNLELAVDAFEDIIDKITTRAIPQSLAMELTQDPEVGAVIPETIVTPADAELLESLLTFFDKFAAENPGALKSETAFARRRVGDIQSRLGNLNEAINAYQLADDAFAELAETSANSYVLERAAIWNEIGLAETGLGDLFAALEAHQQAREVIEESGSEQAIPAVRFELARSLSLFASVGPRTVGDIMGSPDDGRGRGGNRGRRGRNGSGRNRGYDRGPGRGGDYRGGPANGPPDFRNGPGREVPGREGPGPDAGRERRDGPDRGWDLREVVKQSLAASTRAQEILGELTSEFPGNREYQVEYARCIQTLAAQSGLMRREADLAQHTRQSAINEFERLCDEFPDSMKLQYELAETLLIRFQFDSLPENQERTMSYLTRANAICKSMVNKRPRIPEYRALLAQSQYLLGRAQLNRNDPDAALPWIKDATEQFAALNTEFPSVIRLRAMKAMTLFYLSQTYRMQGNHDLAAQTKGLALKAIEPAAGEERHLLLEGVRRRISGRFGGGPGARPPGPKPDEI